MSTMMKSKTRNNVRTASATRVRSLTVIAMLSAVAVILMLFEIPLWFAPFFYELDFSEVPVLIGAFALGPVAGILIELVKILLNLVFNGTDTAGVGEIANFLIGCSLVIPAAIIYKRKKTFQAAIIGLGIGTVIMVAIGSVLNAYVLLPAYSYFYGMPIDALIEIGTKVNSNITDIATLVLYAVIPFNLLKGVVVSLITILLYKRLSIIIKSFTR